MTAFLLCAGFNLFPEKTEFLPNFSFSGFNFNVLGFNPKVYISDNGNERGLKFPNNGLEIELPVPINTVNLRIGTFGGPVDVSALDSSGSVIRKKVAPEQKYYFNIRLSGSDIASLILSGGRNEAILLTACISVFSC